MNQKRLCCFYVNDVHLITMLLPYINKRINESTKVITILEKDMSRGAKKVMEEIQGKKHKNLFEMDWTNKSLGYLLECDLKEKLILIAGSDEFMKEANKIITNRGEKCTILNCYETMQGSSRIQEILDAHDKVVNTSGERNPEEVFFGYVAQKDCKKIML